MSNPDQPKLPLDPVERRRERVGVERPDGERWEHDPVVRTRTGRVCRESELLREEVEAGGITYLEETAEDLDEDGQPYPF